MTTPVKADVDAATQDTLTGLAVGDQTVLEEVLAFRESEQASSGLDARTFCRQDRCPHRPRRAARLVPVQVANALAAAPRRRT